MTKQQPPDSPSPAGSGQSPSASSPRAGAGPETPESSGWKMTIIVMLGVLVVGAAVWFARGRAAGAEKKGPGARSMELPPVPVIAGTVAQKDVPIYLTGIGNVQAFNTVTVRARVDGQIDKIAFTEGQDVHEGDLLAQIDPDPFHAILAQAVAKKGQDEALIANARVDLKRYADMLANEGVTQQQYDTQKALVDQLIATVNSDQATIDSAKVMLAYTTINSPIDGRIGLRLVDKGNIVRASDLTGIVVITQLKPISVVFLLPEQALGPIQQQCQGTAPSLAVLAFSQGDTNVVGEGKLAVIDNQIDPSTRQFKLKATFPNTDLRLWPGQFVNARLLLTVQKGAIVVPKVVIQRGPEGDFAFVIKDDQTVEVRPVKVATTLAVQVDQGDAIIEAGLQPGERVVVEGQFKLQQGSRVRLA
ncbi:MAG: efflux RND transporter periplasmic adaptor subunit, partial [Verrucomicrobia bacterium]|nr:efflux RND transporter periplasmic adaptor subunit [Verrucomicrobiota bacterium]